MRDRWDVIIVGARCAGATSAAILARSGLRVLVLDADARGTDMPMSTHYLQPAGVAALDRLGVGDRVRAVTPPTRVFRLALDEAEILSPTTPGRPGYCVRRGTLDPLLQDAAERAGAELRFRARVVELVREGDRVAGVVVQTASGRETLRADLVVGADGMHSTVAKLVGAPEYLAEDSTRGGFWAYYPAPKEWPHPWDATLEHRGDVLRYVFRSDGDLVLAVSVHPRAEVERWGKAYPERLRESFAASPSTRPLVEGQAPVGKIMGLMRMRWFYRQATGPGWALIGDAGHFKDFVTGQGMTDALFDAERLARALLADSREAALEHFWRERDVETLPVHYDALAQGAVGYNSPLMRWIIGHAGRTPAVVDRVRHVFDRTIEPDALIPGRYMARWMLEALLRGRFDVLRGFFAFGKKLQGQKREYESRRALLTRAAARLAEPKALPAPTAATLARNVSTAT